MFDCCLISYHKFVKNSHFKFQNHIPVSIPRGKNTNGKIATISQLTLYTNKFKVLITLTLQLLFTFPPAALDSSGEKMSYPHIEHVLGTRQDMESDRIC